MAAASAAREQELAWLLARRSQVIFDRLPRLLGQLELDRPPCIPLSHRRALGRAAVRRNILDPEGHHVAATQLAVDRQVEHGEVAGATSTINRVLIECLTRAGKLVKAVTMFGACRSVGNDNAA